MTIDIGTRRQLFFDNHIVEMVQTMTRRMHLPVKHERNPLIRKDRPWEKDPYFRTGTVCVTYDPTRSCTSAGTATTRGTTRRSWPTRPRQRRAGRGPGAGGRKSLSEAFMVSGFQFETTDNHWLYAESEDGIEWRKPELDLPGRRRPQDQHLPGRRPPWRGVRGLLLPRRA